MGAENLPVAGKFVDDALAELFQENINQLISDMGRSILIYLPPVASGCPNCEQGFDGSSQGVIQASNPFPLGSPFNKSFPTGGVCPVCFPVNSFVQVDTGYKNIEHVRPSDVVKDRFGNNKVVHNISEIDYSGKFVKFEIDGIEEFKCTEDHEIYILRNGEVKKVKAKNTQIGDFTVSAVEEKDIDCISWYVDWAKYCVNKYTKKQSCAIKRAYGNGLSSNVISDVVERDKSSVLNIIRDKVELCNFDEVLLIDNDFLYIIGWYICEGSLHFKNKNTRSINYCLCIDENDVADKIINIFRKKFGIAAKKEIRKSKNTIYVHINNSEIAKWFFDVIGRGSSNKRIPEYLYCNLSNKQLLRLVEILIDGDGYRRRSENVLTTTSRQLAYQVFSILRNNNLLPRIYSSKRVNRLRAWQVAYSGNICHHLIKRYVENNNEFRQIKNISLYEDSCKVYNLEVCTEHSYNVNNVSVSNCQGTHQILTEQTVSYTALIQRDPEDFDFTQAGIDVDRRNIYRTKTQLVAFEDIKNSSKALIEGDVCERIRDPVKTGLRDLAYVQAWWKKVNK